MIETREGVAIIEVTRNTKTIATFWGMGDGRFPTEDEALEYAKLFDAAEDLLKACKAIVDHDENAYVCGLTIWEAVALCKDAIEKAEGGR